MNPSLSTEEASGRLFRIYRIVSAILVAVAVVLRTLNLFGFYEADIGYYRTGSVLPTVFRIFVLLCTLFFAIFAFILGKHAERIPSKNSATVGASLLVALTFAVTALWRYCFSAALMTTSTIFAFVTGGLAAVYFILFAFGKLSAPSALLTGLGTILWFGCILSASYFDITVPMNAPLKLVLQLACLGGMLLMLSEMRLCCGARKQRFTLFALPAATLYLLSSAIPSIIADVMGILNARDLAYTDFACLALGLFALVRLLSPFRAEPNAPCLSDEESADTDALCEAAASGTEVQDSEPPEEPTTNATESGDDYDCQ